MIIDLAKLDRCPATLKENHTTYSPGVRIRLFGKRKVSHILPFSPPRLDPQIAAKFRENRSRLSISGVQAKLSMKLVKNKLILTPPGERGQYILKPIPRGEHFQFVDEVPANEHLTMQIAQQVYGIQTAENGLVFFENGEPAYITRRFDYMPDGKKVHQEDFASLMGRSRQRTGDAFKYDGSYLEMAQFMQGHIPAYPVEAMKFYDRILFNFVFCNGDAHLKNFSVRHTSRGDYILSPVYDLLNTNLHFPGDTAFALEEGLYEDYYLSSNIEMLGFTAYDDFLEFGEMMDIKERVVKRILDKYRTSSKKVRGMVERSFLSKPMQESYLKDYDRRVKALNISLSGKI